MKKFALILLLLCIVPAHAFVDRNIAVVKIMNKAAGKTKTVSVPVGSSADIEKMNIAVKSCKMSDPYEPEDFYAFLQISRGDARIFSGWMSRNEPGDNPLQDADYDVWLIGCD